MSPLLTLDKEKSPSIPVIVPLVVPFTTTEAPMTVSPVPSFTIPVQAPFCCVIFTSVTPGLLTAYAAPVEAPIRNSIILTDFSRFNIAVIFKCLLKLINNQLYQVLSELC